MLIRVEPDRPDRPDVRALLAEHLAEMRATSPPGSVHALDLTGLLAPDITFLTAREDGRLLGCGALRALPGGEGEVKSMRTTAAARGRGVATLVLQHLLDTARTRGWRRLSLETGAQDHFEPARRLYRRHGFVDTGPFEGYGPDPNSVYLTRELDPPDRLDGGSVGPAAVTPDA